MKAPEHRSRPRDRPRRMPQGPVETLRVGSLAAGGAGVARRAGGQVVFVPQALPGELVEAEVAESGSPLRGRLVRLVEPSPDRVKPPCAFVASCGGCDWMHLAGAAQAHAHAEIVRLAIEHATSIKVPEIRVHRAPAELRYRTRARLFVQAERGRARVGYRAAGSHDLAEVSTCLTLDPSLDAVIGDLVAVLAGSSGEGDVLLARGAQGRPTVELAFRGELASEAFRAIDDRVSTGAWAGASVRLEGTTRPAPFGDPRGSMEGADGAPLVIAGGAFAQSSDAGAAMLARRIDELARLHASRPKHVVELFAGSGTLSILLARGAASFTAVEVDAAAVTSAQENLRARGLAAKVVTADAGAFAIPPRTEVVVLDPPRTGARGAAENIAKSGARTVVYASCDPATLARDLRVLVKAGFGLREVETFELFPQTSHVETAVRLVRGLGA